MSKSHPKVIKSREQYREYMNEFMSFFGKNLDDNEDLKDRYELLGVLIQDYERKEFPPEKPSALDAILFEMDQRGLSQKDMVEYLGSRSKVSEVLNGKRKLSKAMITKLHYELDIPLDVLIQKPEDIDGRNESQHFQSKNQFNLGRADSQKFNDRSEWHQIQKSVQDKIINYSSDNKFDVKGVQCPLN